MLDKPNRKAIKALALLTFNEAEEQMFVRYCEEHSGVTREVGQEFLIMYYVNHSRYLEAIRMHRQLLPDEERDEDAMQLQQANRRFEEASSSSNGPRVLTRSQKRQVLIDNLILVLPTTQREILELEDGQPGVPANGTSNHHSISSATTTKGLLLSLMQEVGGPLTSLKGLDLNWVARSLTRHVLEEEIDQDTTCKDDKVNGSEVEATFLPAQLVPNGNSSKEDATGVSVEELEQFSDASLPGSKSQSTAKSSVAQQSQTSRKQQVSEVEIIDSDDDL